MTSTTDNTQKTDFEVLERVKKNTYKMVFRIFVIFSISAALAAVLGYFIDEALNIRPVGTMFLLGVFYIISWGFLLKNIKEMKEISQIDKKNE